MYTKTINEYPCSDFQLAKFGKARVYSIISNLRKHSVDSMPLSQMQDSASISSSSHINENEFRGQVLPDVTSVIHMPRIRRAVQFYWEGR